MRHCVLLSNGAAEKPKALTADVGLIRVVVPREAPSSHADGNPNIKSVLIRTSSFP